MFILQVAFGTPEFDEMLALRYKVLREPLGLDFTAEQIAAEFDSIHLACYDAEWGLHGCLTLLPLGDGEVKMRQVVVAERSQRQGIGKMLVDAAEDLARRRGFTRMVLHARETAVPFYKKLGYFAAGELFFEVGIPHFEMQKDL